MSAGTALMVVGLVLGAKTMIDGLKEGNLLKAVVGGVGAYFGAAGLMGGAAAAGGSAVGGEVAAGATMDAGLAGTSMADLGTIGPGSEFAFNAAGTGALATPLATSANLAAGTAATPLMGQLGVQGVMANNVINGSMLPDAGIGQASNLLDPAPPVEAIGSDMSAGTGGESNLLTQKAPNVKMENPSMLGGTKETLGTMWDSAKESATSLGEFAKENPFIATQMVGSGMQLLAGNQANKTAEDLAEKRQEWEQQQMMLSATPANIYFDAQGVARDQNGQALGAQT